MHSNLYCRCDRTESELGVTISGSRDSGADQFEGCQEADQVLLKCQIENKTV